MKTERKNLGFSIEVLMEYLELTLSNLDFENYKSLNF